jgi:hypothetical protein
MKCTCGKTKGKCTCSKGYAAGGLKMPGDAQKGLKKLPTAVRNKMGYMSKGGMAKKGYKDGGFCTGPAKGYKK